MLYGVLYLITRYDRYVNPWGGKGLKMSAVGLAAKIFDADGEVTVALMEVFGF